MNYLDAVVLAVVFIGFILGYKDGLVRKIIGLAGFALAVLLAALYSDWLGKIVESVFGIEFYLSQIIAGIVIFLATVFVFSVIKRLVHPFDKVNNFINQTLGGVIGAVQLLYFLSGVFFILNIFGAPSEHSKENSIFYQKVYNIIPATVNYINSYTPKTKEIIKDYINEKDST